MHRKSPLQQKRTARLSAIRLCRYTLKIRTNPYAITAS